MNFDEGRIMGGEYGLLITFWKWRVKVVGTANWVVCWEVSLHLP